MEDKTLCGELAITKDGIIFIVDIESMEIGGELISYKSIEKYPDIYEWLHDNAEIKSSDGLSVDARDITPRRYRDNRELFETIYYGL